jgi:AmpD protein
MIHFTPLEAGSKTNRPKMIVVHAMGEFLLDPKPIHATDFLEKIRLSAHALVAPSGNIYICRDDDQGAYHAKGYNTDSLGIEILVAGHHNYGSFLEKIKTDWVTDEQWEAAVTAVSNWMQSYDIPLHKVVRHSDISPGRKVDPGVGFKWEKFLEALAAK